MLRDVLKKFAAYTVDELLLDAGFPRIDLLKVDIEGAELQVFRDGNTEFLLKTRGMAAVECHSAECVEAFESAVCDGFHLRDTGELRVAERP